jgi:DNA helicase II / ATP-dependent DNA helicase PcrA
MRRQAIPYRLIGSVRFYDRREIRDIMSYLKLIANPADDEAFRRAVAVPKRGVGDTSIDQLAEEARSRGVTLLDAAASSELLTTVRPAARAALGGFATLIGRLRERASEAGVDELLRELIDAVGYEQHLRAEGPEGEDRIENVRELITSAAETVADEEGEVGLRPLDHFLQRASLVADIDGLDASADAVTLMTLHNAKGLEFPVVFITGLEDGLFPLARAYEDPAMLEEERRLFYVGITRAETKLYLTHAEERRRNGELLPGRRSGFLDGSVERLLESISTVKVRSSGRSVSWSASGRWGSGSQRGDRGGAAPPASIDGFDDALRSRSPTVRRPGTPVIFHVPDEEVSQVAPVYALGVRVRHRKFGAGTIAELAGSGRDAKVKIDFDDEEFGRKTLVIAQANLEREDD